MGRRGRIATGRRRLARAVRESFSPGGLAVLVLGLALSLAAGLVVTDRDRRRRDDRIQAQLRLAAQALPARLQRTEVLLRAAPSLAPGAPRVTAARWRASLDRLEIETLVPSVQATMLIEPAQDVKATEVPRHLPGVSQAGARLRLVAPATSTSGFLTASGRGAAAVTEVLERARDTARPQLSRPVAFPGGVPGTEMLVVAPYYDGDAPGATVAERRRRVRAWVAAAFSTDVYLTSALTSLDPDVALQIADRTGPRRIDVARYAREGAPRASAFDHPGAVTITLLNRRWVLRATTTSAVPLLSWRAVLVGLVLTWFVVAQLATRRLAERRALALAADRTAALQRRTDQLQHQTLHDALTGLANRVLVQDRLQHALQHRSARSVAVLLIDLDRFKRVNDSYGHAPGDAVLAEAARRLRRAVRPDDTVGRLGGDEFAIIADLERGDAVAVVAQRIVEAFRLPMQVADRDLVLTVSVGAAVGAVASDPDGLMHAADAAMYRVKRAGGNAFALFDDTMHARALDRLQLETDLRAAIDAGEIVVHYQPTVDARTRRLTAVEALARWQRPDGIVPPAGFIGVAEESGLIIPIGAAVLDQALAQAGRWRAAGSVRRVWVNVSARQLTRESFVDDVRHALERHEAPGDLLGLEVTESALLEDPDHARRSLAALRGLDVAIAVDDFGTGYSSFERLKAFGLDVVKLDRSFVAGVNTDRYDRAIVEAVVHMAHGLGATLVAEGVETEEQAATLVELGCDVLQGFLFARPGPSAQIDALARAAGVQA